MIKSFKNIIENNSICNTWNPDLTYNTVNYTFYNSLNESIESNQIERNFAIKIYNQFRQSLLSKLTSSEKLLIQQDLFHKFSSFEDIYTNISTDIEISVDCDFSLFGLKDFYRKLTFIFVTPNELKGAEAAFYKNGNIITIKITNNKTDKLKIVDIKKYYKFQIL